MLRKHRLVATFLVQQLGYTLDKVYADACRLEHAMSDRLADRLEEVLGFPRHERNAIPHEIGLALGYPVKDVLGFMGLLPLDCSGCCCWRIYGDPADSLALSRRYAEANRRALHFLYA